MRIVNRGSLAGAAICVGMAGVAQGAAQVALHKVNTSVGLLPTNATNKWKLQTDPEEVDHTFDSYIPIEGSLSNSYDPTKFHLATNPFTNQYALGDTVIGLGPFQVLGFDVLFNNGGMIDVQENPTDPAMDTITNIGEPADGESGQVLNIHFKLITDRRSQADSATSDQLFYEINLLRNDETPSFDPGEATTFPDAQSFLTIAPRDPSDTTDPPITTLFDGINPSSNVPEPATIGLVGMGLLALIRRRH